VTRRVFISADHGLALVYFLQSEVVSTLLNAGVEIVLLTDDGLVGQINERFTQPGLHVEGLRLDQARKYAIQYKPALQFWVDFLRRAGASKKINLEAVDSYINQVKTEAHARRKRLFPFVNILVGVLRRFRLARRALVRFQWRFDPKLYTSLFEEYKPDMIIASTPGWRWDRYLLREGASRGVITTSVIVGWDNTSSYSLPGADVDWITCWSEIQKQELIDGSDWPAEKVNVGGIPSYDGYFNKRWLMSREDYFTLHNLDPARKLISYASSFISFSPNIQNIEALANLVNGDKLSFPSQLLVRLHPNHFLDVERFAQEREQVRKLAREMPNVHVVEPVPLGGSLGYYSGEDMPEKTSMMAYSDVFVTVYSTMVVEATIHERPVVSACIDSLPGWPMNFTLPLSEIGNWPTHLRFRESEAGRVAHTEEELGAAINYYLENPDVNLEARRAFITNECTYTDGSAGKRTAEFLLSLLGEG
jgi:hypothetical protein